jgi:hypothetical protein
VINLLEETIFYLKNICTAFKQEYGNLIGEYEALEKYIQRGRSAPIMSVGMIYQPSYPFDEWPLLSLDFLTILQMGLKFSIQHETEFLNFKESNSKSYILSIAIRMMVAALNKLEPALWVITFQELLPIISEKEAISGEYIWFLIGSLHDSIIGNAGVELVEIFKKLVGIFAAEITNALPTVLTCAVMEKNVTCNESFELFLKSSEWTKFYDKILFKSIKKIELTFIDTSEHVCKNFIHYSQTNHARLREFFSNRRIVIDSLLDRLSDESAMLMRKSRLSELLNSYENDNREISKLWQTCAEEVTYDRRVWHVATSWPIYRLESTENTLRMRLRIVRDLDGKLHQSASSKRDRVKLDHPIVHPAPFLTLPNRKTILIKRLENIDLNSGLVCNQKNNNISNDFDSRYARDPSIVYDSQLETCLYSFDCELVILLNTVKGRLEITNTHLRFFPDLKRVSESLAAKTSLNLFLKEFKIFGEHRRPLHLLREIFLRRFNLRNSALEAFFSDGQNFFINFNGTQKEADKKRRSVLKLLKKLNLPEYVPPNIEYPVIAFEKTTWTNRWVNREITNFEYLMALNTYSGRTYNDLTQYPVFPWILIDYKSTHLDLEGKNFFNTDPSIYRDLSKPIGAINPDRLKILLDRLKSFDDSGDIPKFLYGSHYSSAAAVIFYLIRIEPFTTHHISMQGGKFDIADRLFRSFHSLWESVYNSTSDVKELIPEFFYFPEFLKNCNGFDLGKTQSGESVSDVILPPWANSAEDFIKKHRDALESEHVSRNLHNWIDLIWGVKQTGDEALAAHNLFYYLTYEDAVNIDVIEDPIDRQSIEDQVHYFGQTPSRLFKEAHPRRMTNSSEPSLLVCCSETHFSTLSDTVAIFNNGFGNEDVARLILCDLSIAICQVESFSIEDKVEFVEKRLCKSE